MRECCLKYLLSDRRIHLINLGMRWEHEVATNSQVVDDFEPPYLPLALGSLLAQYRGDNCPVIWAQ